MKTTRWIIFVLLILPAAWVVAQVTNNASTNAVPVLPGLTGTGQVDVVSLVNLTILALTPMVMQGFKKIMPKLPDFALNLLAPALGALLGAGLNALGVSTTTGWGAMLWGGLGTWLYEFSHNARFYAVTKLNGGGASSAPPPASDK